MTGAPLPDGADAVVMIERTETPGPGTVRVLERAQPGQHVRPAGDDVTRGSEVLPAGAVVGPAALGVLASIGCRSVRAFRRLSVGVLSTGDEVVDVGWAPTTGRRPEVLRGAGPGSGERPTELPDEATTGSAPPPGTGQIWDANRPLLLSSLAAIGCDAIDLGVVGDDEDAIADRLVQGLGRCDAVLTSGGASLGDFDWARGVLDRLSGGTMRWLEVAIKPAKPLAFGSVSGKPVLCLPGNPVSSLVSFELFARPLLRRMAGDPQPCPVLLNGVVDEDVLRKPDGKLHLVRVTVRVDGAGVLRARPVQAQGAHHLAAAARASALALVPDGTGLAAGSQVRIMLLAGPSWASPAGSPPQPVPAAAGATGGPWS